MCDICNSLFGHLSSCPEGFSDSDGPYCASCESEIGSGEKVVVLCDGRVYCPCCFNSFDIYELCEIFDAESTIELIEKLEQCKTVFSGRY